MVTNMRREISDLMAVRDEDLHSSDSRQDFGDAVNASTGWRKASGVEHPSAVERPYHRLSPPALWDMK